VPSIVLEVQTGEQLVGEQKYFLFNWLGNLTGDYGGDFAAYWSNHTKITTRHLARSKTLKRSYYKSVVEGRAV